MGKYKRKFKKKQYKKEKNNTRYTKNEYGNVSNNSELEENNINNNSNNNNSNNSNNNSNNSNNNSNNSNNNPNNFKKNKNNNNFKQQKPKTEKSSNNINALISKLSSNINKAKNKSTKNSASSTNINNTLSKSTFTNKTNSSTNTNDTKTTNTTTDITKTTSTTNTSSNKTKNNYTSNQPNKKTVKRNNTLDLYLKNKTNNANIIVNNQRKKVLYESLLFFKKKATIQYDKTKYFALFANKKLKYDIDTDFSIDNIKNNIKLLNAIEYNMKLTILKTIYEIILKYFLFAYIKSKQHSIIFFITVIASIGLILIPPISLFGIGFLSVGGIGIMNIILNSVSVVSLLSLSVLSYNSFRKTSEVIASTNEIKLLLNKILFDTDEDGHLNAYSTSIQDSVFKSCRKYLVKLFKDNIFIYRDPVLKQYFAVIIDLDSFRRLDSDNDFNIFYNLKAIPIKSLGLNKFKYKSFYSRYIKRNKQLFNHNYNNIPNNNYILNFNDKNNNMKLFTNNIQQSFNSSNYKCLNINQILQEEIKLSNSDRKKWEKIFRKPLLNEMKELQYINKPNKEQEQIIANTNKSIPEMNENNLINVLSDFDPKYLSEIVYTKQKYRKRTLYNKFIGYMFSK